MGLFGTSETRIDLDYTKPFIFLNFKTYPEASGINALKLGYICEKIQKKSKINIIICPQATDIQLLTTNLKIPVFAQHVDFQKDGQSTGSITVENLIRNRVHGSIINHSEKRLDIDTIKKTLLKMKEYNVISILCAKDAVEAKKFSNLKPVAPDFIAIEPPELIGGEKSVSTAKPQLIEKSIKSCKDSRIIMGAGIKTNEDVKTSLKLGSKGVLISSHFVLSKNPEEFLIDIIKDI